MLAEPQREAFVKVIVSAVELRSRARAVVDIVRGPKELSDIRIQEYRSANNALAGALAALELYTAGTDLRKPVEELGGYRLAVKAQLFAITNGAVREPARAALPTKGPDHALDLFSARLEDVIRGAQTRLRIER